MRAGRWTMRGDVASRSSHHHWSVLFKVPKKAGQGQQRRPARDSRLNPIAYGTKTGESGFRAWLSGNVDRFNWLGDDLHAAAVTLAKEA